MRAIFNIPLAIFVSLLKLVFPTIILLPVIFSGYLIYNGAWSELFFFFLSTLIAAIGTFLLLFVSGLLGPIVIICVPIFYTAYIQHDLYFSYLDRFNNSYPIIFTYVFVMQSTITLAFLGKGHENEISVSIFRLAMFAAGCAVLFLLNNHIINSYWQILLVNGLGALISFLLVFLLERKNTESSF